MWGSVGLLGVYLGLGDHSYAAGLTLAHHPADSSPTVYLCSPPPSTLPPYIARTILLPPPPSAFLLSSIKRSLIAMLPFLSAKGRTCSR